MPKYEVKAPDGQSFEVNAPEGASEQDAIAYVQREFYGPKQVSMPVPEKGFGERLEQNLQGIPRQLGLTARYGIEGTMGALGVASDPLAAMMNTVSPRRIPSAGRTGTIVADTLGLPKPQTQVEKTVGDASRLVAGTAGGIGLAGKVAQNIAPSISKSVMTNFAANPSSQLLSAGGGGLAGGYVKETGGGPTSQFAAALVGGLAAPAAAAVAQKLAATTKNFSASFFKPEQLDAQVDITIENALKESGVKLADLPINVRNQLREDVSSAMGIGKLSPDALRRAADYRMVGATPMRGNLTLNPVDVIRGNGREVGCGSGGDGSISG